MLVPMPIQTEPLKFYCLPYNANEIEMIAISYLEF
jgi:hypothetical protein